jgi:hypothetical protein
MAASSELSRGSTRSVQGADLPARDIFQMQDRADSGGEGVAAAVEVGQLEHHPAAVDGGYDPFGQAFPLPGKISARPAVMSRQSGVFPGLYFCSECRRMGKPRAGGGV